MPKINADWERIPGEAGFPEEKLAKGMKGE
jgi:hypothetical protein